MVAGAQDDLTDPARNLRRDLRSPRQFGANPDVSSPEMPHLHLPAGHDDQDVAIATALARALRSAELYVTHLAGKPARPVSLTACDEPARRRPRGLKRLFRRAA